MIGQILLEAFVVGVSTVVMGSFVGFVMSKIVSTKASTNSGEWNKYYIMELSLFFTGFFLHVVYEILGLNSWYCKEIFAKTRK